MGIGINSPLILRSHGFVRQEAYRTKKNRQGMTRNGYYETVECVKNIAKGRYWLTPKFLHRFKILSAICLDPLSSSHFYERSAQMTLSALWLLSQPDRVSHAYIHTSWPVGYSHPRFYNARFIPCQMHSFFLIDECILLSKVKYLLHISYTLSERHISCKKIECSGTVPLKMRVDTLQ